MDAAETIAVTTSAASDALTGEHARRRAAELLHELKTGDVRRAIDASRSLCARGRALEARHFGFAVLRDVARHRWRELRTEERVEMAQLAHGLLNEVAMSGGEPEPYVIKSKTATLMAEVVRQECAGTWNQLVPDLVNMTLSDEPQRAELGVNVIRFVAEDVAVYNDDLIGGRMRELLGSLSSTVGTILPAIYSLMEKHYLKATSTQDGRIAKQHSAAVSAALGAAAVYSEWAPLAPIMRSGLIEACGMLLASEEFRCSACDALRHVVARRSNVAQGAGESDEADIIKGLTTAANALSTAADRVMSHPNQSELASDADEIEFIKRLGETMAVMSSFHLSTLTDENARNTFLEKLMGLTRFPQLEVLEVVVAAWPVMLRAMGAELPKTFTRGPPSQGANNPYNAPKAEPNGILPMGAAEALIDIGRVWLNAGAGIASGFDSQGIPGNKASDWADDFESAVELREKWVQLRAKWSDVIKLCTALCPSNAAQQASQNTLAVLSWTQPGGPIANRSDETKCAALEGATSFLEAIMAALPTDGPSFSVFSPTLEALLNQLVAVDFRAPLSNAQVAKLLETFGKFARARPELAATIMSRMFTILNELPADATSGAPPVRQRDIIASGRTGQAARQKVCAAILIVCSAAPMALNPHLEAFAGQIETMKASGRLSGAERGSLAEALLAVAGPSGPARVREVLEWLLSAVRNRWAPGGVISPEVTHLLSVQTMAAGEASGGTQGLSSAHWELFHDVQLVDRCLRRSLGEGDVSKVTSGLIKPVDPPPPISECPAADHIEWAVVLVQTLSTTIHALWTPEGKAAMNAAGLGASVLMSPEEKAAYLTHGPARTAVLSDEDEGTSATAAASRDWMRCLRDCSYSVFTMLSIHAPAAFYPNQALASACGNSLLAHLPYMDLRHVRQAVHAAVRPIVGRCPPAHRPMWHAALVNPLCAVMHEKLATAWMDKRVVNATKDMDNHEGDGEDVQVDDLISERILRDVTRDVCAVLSLVAAPDGTFGRKTKGSGMPGVIGGMSNTLLSTSYAGGKHIISWLANGEPNGVRAGVAIGSAALNWDDAEATGHAVSFVRGVTAAAGSAEAPQALCETVGSDVFQACMVALTQSSNAAHQADILGLIRDIIVWLLPKTQSVAQILMSLPGMTQQAMDSCVRELGAMRSEKKAANLVKDFLINASGGGEELRALVEARSSAAKSGSAIQIPKTAPRNPAKQQASSPDAASGFSAEAASDAIGL